MDTRERIENVHARYWPTPAALELLEELEAEPTLFGPPARPHTGPWARDWDAIWRLAYHNA